MMDTARPKAPLLEIACFDAESALVAWTAGADRIELCDGKEDGGTTPSLASVEYVRRHVEVPLYAMIRPRGGNFVYSDEEYQQMQTDLCDRKPLVDGLVFGILDHHGKVDVERTTKLVAMAHPLPCTFHRAFDETEELQCALEDVISTGCLAVLTSGGHPDALAGASMLASLVRRAGKRILVLAGGGVRASNVSHLQRLTKAGAFHSSGIIAGALQVDPVEVASMRNTLLANGVEGAAGGRLEASSTQQTVES